MLDAPVGASVSKAPELAFSGDHKRCSRRLEDLKKPFARPQKSTALQDRRISSRGMH